LARSGSSSLIVTSQAALRDILALARKNNVKLVGREFLVSSDSFAGDFRKQVVDRLRRAYKMGVTLVCGTDVIGTDRKVNAIDFTWARKILAELPDDNVNSAIIRCLAWTGLRPSAQSYTPQRNRPFSRNGICAGCEGRPEQPDRTTEIRGCRPSVD